jgi:hypothetical protein
MNFFFLIAPFIAYTLSRKFIKKEEEEGRRGGGGEEGGTM